MSMIIAINIWLIERFEAIARARGVDGGEGDRGQATAEYALVLLGAAAIAGLFIAWATAGGGAGKIANLLDRVMDSITSRV